MADDFYQPNRSRFGPPWNVLSNLRYWRIVLSPIDFSCVREDVAERKHLGVRQNIASVVHRAPPINCLNAKSTKGVVSLDV
jgi:hypothetical protein